MLKKILLGTATFILAIAAYYLLSESDRTAASPAALPATDAISRFITIPTTQAGPTIRQGLNIRPGEQTRARIYDEVTGRLKYQFEAQRWEPVSDSDFHLAGLEIQIHTTRGQITYISADEGTVTLVRGAGDSPDPKRGSLRGHVRVIIDRTTSEWRKANPNSAERDAHPESLINISLDDARFDMDRAELISDGDILIDSTEVRIEQVTGLTIQWNQMSNRIDSLRFAHGGVMKLRRGGRAIEFTLPGTERGLAAAGDDVSASGERPPRVDATTEVPLARAMQPTSVARITAEEAAEAIRFEGGGLVANRPRVLTKQAHDAVGADRLRTAQELATAIENLKSEARAGTSGIIDDALPSERPDRPHRRVRIDTYRAIFHHQVVVEQKDGLRSLGKIEAGKLEVNFDFGRKQRSLTLGQSLEANRAENATPGATRSETPDHPVPEETAPDRTKLILTWDGPLELRPLTIEPALQTGERFDVIATGDPVRLTSNQGAEQGNARCRQLVYRHERRQVWLAGSESEDIELAISDHRRLRASHLFYDQSRGLARVDGEGLMIDTRGSSAGGIQLDAFVGSESTPDADAQNGTPVEIRWTDGVDLEIGKRRVRRTNPATGLKEERERDYLRRAWFHGDVRVQQGSQFVSGDELAATFGTPNSDAELADHIQHIDVAGKVRLEGDRGGMSADHLEVELTVTSDGRNIPRVADGDGDVFARQGTLEFRADRMHAVLAPTASQSRLGIEVLDAEGNVHLTDPAETLRITRAQTLRAVIHNGNQLARATIVSAEPDIFAKARMRDFAIHAHKIEIDGDRQSIDVAGPGLAFMRTDTDFSSRRLEQPVIMRTRWDKQMKMRMAENYGVFVGNVRTRSLDSAARGSPAFALDCNQLTVRFAPIPPGQRNRKAPQPDGLIDKILTQVRGNGESAALVDQQVTLNRAEKRPVSVLAEGNAVALASTNAATDSTGDPGRLLSRMRIAGDRIEADLVGEQVSVPSGGSMLIEDYQFGTEQAGRRSPPLMSSLRDEGPSQTAVTWQNSMDFLRRSGLVVFDRNVQMVHRSGQQLVLKEDLARAMRLDSAALRLGSGRETTLSCGNLTLEFKASGPGDTEGYGAMPVRATELKRLIATHAVLLQDGPKNLMGERLQYRSETGEVILEGSESLEARIIDQDETDQRFTRMTGRRIIWNRRTNRIDVPEARLGSRRR